MSACFNEETIPFKIENLINGQWSPNLPFGVWVTSLLEIVRLFRWTNQQLLLHCFNENLISLILAINVVQLIHWKL